MLHLHSANSHHESGPKRVARDSELVQKVMAALESNPYTDSTTNLINGNWQNMRFKIN